MRPPLFKIRNLRCEYIPGKTVLHLRQLDIPSQRLVFIIGKSGVGKSTLIETLGLMNKTIAADEDSSVLFVPGDGKEHELKNSWNLANKELSEFRRKHFSFIFQNTNLMPNFSSGENMVIGLLIEGKSFVEAKKEVLEVMDRLSLSHEVFDKKITEISGGQRQRLAFVRAITSDFTVLFGDEPTGNLDQNTSEELMSVLKDLVRDKGKSAIVVSHDLMLAEKFADMIIPITVEWNEDGMPVGDILPENILRREDGAWVNASNQPMLNPIPFLNEFLSPVQFQPAVS